MNKFLTVASLILFSSISHALETVPLQYTDFTNKTHKVSLMNDGKSTSIYLEEFNYTVSLEENNLKKGMDGLISKQVPMGIASKSDGYKLHSVAVILDAHNSVKTVESARKSITQMNAEQRIDVTADQICPKDSVGSILIGIRDLGPYSFCLTRTKIGQ